jgi:hypothetical protein
MIRYALICEQGHDFEAWFGSGAAYDEQAQACKVSCPCCGSANVKKAPMAPAVKRNQNDSASSRASRQSPEKKQTYAFLKGLRAHLEANAENVGPAFPEEARKMHYGEAEARSIYGEASLDEAQALEEEGIPAVPLPRLPEDHN